MSSSSHISCSISVVAVLIIVGLSSYSSQAYQFDVGDKRGWGLHASKRYPDWASKNRFQVGDTLRFRYKNGTDSVLVVEKDNYITCNKTNPIRNLENQGDYSIYHLESWGYFYFISGKADNCQNGEKLTVLVIAPRPHPSPSPSPVLPEHAPSSQPSDAPAPAGPSSGSAPLGLSGTAISWLLVLSVGYLFY